MAQAPRERPSAQATTVPAHHAWGWRAVLLLSSVWAGLLVALLSR